jgi:hypothetical protein
MDAAARNHQDLMSFLKGKHFLFFTCVSAISQIWSDLQLKPFALTT